MRRCLKSHIHPPVESCQERHTPTAGQQPSHSPQPSNTWRKREMPTAWACPAFPVNCANCAEILKKVLILFQHPFPQPHAGRQANPTHLLHASAKPHKPFVVLPTVLPRVFTLETCLITILCTVLVLH